MLRIFSASLSSNPFFFHNIKIVSYTSIYLFHTETASFSAMERRILIPNWCGEAWKRLSGQEYDSFRLRRWEQTGALITADSSDDSKITPEGLLGYEVPPPVDYLEPSVEEPNSNVPPNEHVEPVDDDEIDSELQPDVENMAEDDKSDRDFDAELVGTKLRALYENGWFEGDIMYLNTKCNGVSCKLF